MMRWRSCVTNNLNRYEVSPVTCARPLKNYCVRYAFQRPVMQGTLKVLALCLVIAFLFPVVASGREEKKPVKVSALDAAVAPKLAARELAVRIKEKDLAEREKDLAEAEKRVDAKLKRLISLQEKVEARLSELKQLRDKNFKNLIKTYSAMSPSKVAPLLDRMDDREVVKILRAMKSEDVAKILPKIDKDKAVRVSLALGLLRR